MSDVKQFKLPDVGEGLTEAEIVTWKVKVGDTVKINDVIVEIETAKSLVELPCPYAGMVTELLAAEGETVNVGAPDHRGRDRRRRRQHLRRRTGRPEVGSLTEDLVPTPKADEAVEPGLIGGPAPGGRTSVLVGYGPRTTEAKRRPRKRVDARRDVAGGCPGRRAARVHAARHAAARGQHRGGRAGRRATHAPCRSITRPPAPAARCWPSRRCASWPRISASTSRTVHRAPAPTARSPATTSQNHASAARPLPSADRGCDVRRSVTGERETRVPVKGVRKVTAQAMVASAFTAPHVTEWVTVDATRTMKMVERLREDRDFRDVKVSPLLIVARAVCAAIRRTPEVNASWDEAAQEIVLKHYVNLGIAAATPRGLLVPNIKDADQLIGASSWPTALGELTATARDGKTPPAEHERRHVHDHQRRRLRRRRRHPDHQPRRVRRSCAWARSASSPGSWATRSSRAGSPRSRCRSTTASSTASRAHASSPTSPSIVEDPGNALLF